MGQNNSRGSGKNQPLEDGADKNKKAISSTVDDSSSSENDTIKHPSSNRSRQREKSFSRELSATYFSSQSPCSIPREISDHHLVPRVIKEETVGFDHDDSYYLSAITLSQPEDAEYMRTVHDTSDSPLNGNSDQSISNVFLCTEESNITHDKWKFLKMTKATLKSESPKPSTSEYQTSDQRNKDVMIKNKKQAENYFSRQEKENMEKSPLRYKQNFCPVTAEERNKLCLTMPNYAVVCVDKEYDDKPYSSGDTVFYSSPSLVSLKSSVEEQFNFPIYRREREDRSCTKNKYGIKDENNICNSGNTMTSLVEMLQINEISETANSLPIKLDRRAPHSKTDQEKFIHLREDKFRRKDQYKTEDNSSLWGSENTIIGIVETIPIEEFDANLYPSKVDRKVSHSEIDQCKLIRHKENEQRSFKADKYETVNDNNTWNNVNAVTVETIPKKVIKKKPCLDRKVSTSKTDVLLCDLTEYSKCAMKVRSCTATTANRIPKLNAKAHKSEEGFGKRQSEFKCNGSSEYRKVKMPSLRRNSKHIFEDKKLQHSPLKSGIAKCSELFQKLSSNVMPSNMQSRKTDGKRTKISSEKHSRSEGTVIGREPFQISLIKSPKNKQNDSYRAFSKLNATKNCKEEKTGLKLRKEMNLLNTVSNVMDSSQVHCLTTNHDAYYSKGRSNFIKEKTQTQSLDSYNMSSHYLRGITVSKDKMENWHLRKQKQRILKGKDNSQCEMCKKQYLDSGKVKTQHLMNAETSKSNEMMLIPKLGLYFLREKGRRRQMQFPKWSTALEINYDRKEDNTILPQRRLSSISLTTDYSKDNLDISEQFVFKCNINKEFDNKAEPSPSKEIGGFNEKPTLLGQNCKCDRKTKCEEHKIINSFFSWRNGIIKEDSKSQNEGFRASCNAKKSIGAIPRKHQDRENKSYGCFKNKICGLPKTTSRFSYNAVNHENTDVEEDSSFRGKSRQFNCQLERNMESQEERQEMCRISKEQNALNVAEYVKGCLDKFEKSETNTYKPSVKQSYQKFSTSDISNSECVHRDYVSLPIHLDCHIGLVRNLPTLEEQQRKKIMNDWKNSSHSIKGLSRTTLLLSDCSPVAVLFGGINPHDAQDLVIGGAIICFSEISNAWEFFGLMPEPRNYHSVALLDRHIYVVGGYSPFLRREGEMIATATLYSLDICRGTWSRKADMNHARACHGLVTFGDKLYVFGGRNDQGRFLQSAEVYIPAEDQWKCLNPMPEPLIGFGITCSQTEILLIGGMTTCSSQFIPYLVDTVYCFNVSNERWEQKTSLPERRAFCVAAAIGQDIWVWGGCTAGDYGRTTNLISLAIGDVYNPQLNRWEQKNFMNIPRHGAAVCTLGNKIMILGGVSSLDKTAVSDNDVFHPVNCQMSEGIPLPYAIAGASAVEIPQVLKSGHRQQNLYNSIHNQAPYESMTSDESKEGLVMTEFGLSRELPLQIDPNLGLLCRSISYRKGTNRLQEDLNETAFVPPEASNLRHAHHLQDKRVPMIVVLGGVSVRKPHNSLHGKSVMLYNPATDKWEFAGVLPEPRNYHAAALLHGFIYITGGYDPNFRKRGGMMATNTVYAVDIHSRSCIRKAGLLCARACHNLCVVHNKLYALGGRDHKGNLLSSVEAYDPVEDRWELCKSMKSPLMGMAAAVRKDQIWTIGGVIATCNKSMILANQVSLYDVAENEWISKSPLSYPRAYASAVTIRDHLWLFGGCINAKRDRSRLTSVAAVDRYNDELDSWQQQDGMKIPRHASAVVALDAWVYLICGMSSHSCDCLAHTELYIAEGNSESEVALPASFPSALTGVAAVIIPALSLRRPQIAIPGVIKMEKCKSHSPSGLNERESQKETAMLHKF